MSNLTLKWDNAPADDGSLFYVSEVISAFDFVVGTLPLSFVVRIYIMRDIKDILKEIELHDSGLLSLTLHGNGSLELIIDFDEVWNKG